jgi:hypothetical protein
MALLTPYHIADCQLPIADLLVAISILLLQCFASQI